MVTRASWSQYFMLLAEQAATRSTCSRLHVGAVVVQDHHVVSTGFNGAPQGMSHCVHTEDTPCKISVHAEANALLWDRSHSCGLEKYMFVTHAPCYDCAKLILNTSIHMVVYGVNYRSKAGLELLEDGGIKIGRVA
jgi:dCMP deaminase